MATTLRELFKRGRCVGCDARRVLYPDLCRACCEAEEAMARDHEAARAAQHARLGDIAPQLAEMLGGVLAALGHPYCDEGRGCDHGLKVCEQATELLRRYEATFD